MEDQRKDEGLKQAFYTFNGIAPDEIDNHSVQTSYNQYPITGFDIQVRPFGKPLSYGTLIKQMGN